MTTNKNLAQKLSSIMEELQRIPKGGHNDFHGYDFVQEADVLEAVRGKLAARGVIFYPDITDFKREKKESGKGYITDVMVKWTFLDSESGETISFNMPGSGEDVGEKGTFKAITGSSKYAILKSFLIGTGDDPEKDHPGQESEAAPTLPEPTASARPYRLQATDPLMMDRPKVPPKVQQPQTGSLAEGQLMKVEARTWTSRATGKSGTLWDVTVNLEDGNLVASTFDRQLADAAKEAVGQIVRARVSPGKKQGTWNLEGFEEVQVDD